MNMKQVRHLECLKRPSQNNASAPHLTVGVALPPVSNTNRVSAILGKSSNKGSSIQVAVLDDLDSSYSANETPLKSISRDTKAFRGSKGKTNQYQIHT